MAFTHGVRNLVIGSALTAGAMAVMQGTAAADEDPTPANAPSSTGAPTSPTGAPTSPSLASRAESNTRAARPAGEQAVAAPTTTAEEVEQPPPPRPTETSSSGSVTGTAKARTAADITTPGPLTRVQTSPDLNCAVSHAADSTPAFFADTACGTFLAVNGTLFGPDLLRPDSTSPKPRSTYTRVRQSAVSGSGSFKDPHTLVTEVDLGATGLLITQTDSYVAGQESYRTDVTVANAGLVARTAQLYRAGDCVLGDSDEGFGSVDTATGAVACVGADDSGANTVSTSRTQQWYPISPGSHFYEDRYASVWARIGSQLPFPDLCAACTTYRDNAAGLSWEITVPAGGSVTRSHLTVFSLDGAVPLTIHTAPKATTALAGSVVTYRVVILNPNDLNANLRSVAVNLDAGFSYVPGTTTGGFTTVDPTVNGQVLTWTAPFQFGFGGVAHEFDVRVPSVPGTYLNQARADAGPHAVVPSVESTGITVLAGPDAVTPPVAPTSVRGVALVQAATNALTPLSPRALETPSLTASRAGGTLPVTGSDPQNLLVLATLLLAAGGGCRILVLCRAS